MQLEVGAVLDGRVTGITAFGAFVELPNGKSGLVHISEVANTYVRDVRDYLTEQQTVRVKVLSLGPGNKIALSIKQAAPPPQPAAPKPRESREPRRPEPRPAPQDLSSADLYYVPESSGDRSFEDKLKRFMQESNGKMSGSVLYQPQRKSQRRRK